MEIVFDDTYNKSVVLDYEQKLIKYCKADGKFNIINRNVGQSAQHDYYKRAEYGDSFKQLWGKLFNLDLVQNSMDILENKEIFKYSPYTTLTEEQSAVSIDIFKDILKHLEENEKGVSLVNGCAGTGKTVLATSMINSLVNVLNLTKEDIDNEIVNSEKFQVLLKIKEYVQKHHKLKIGFVFPMTGIRGTMEKVFKVSGNGLSKNMILSPFDLKEEYDIVFVDESHRLKRRKNLGPQYGLFDSMCRKLSLNPEKDNQLDWVLLKSKYTVLFYDKDQSIKASDIPYKEYNATINKYFKEVNRLNLTTQMRCLGGDSYIDYVKSIMDCTAQDYQEVLNYDFKIFDDVKEMVDNIKSLDNKMQLCKTVSGYSWEWKTQQANKKDNYDAYNSIIKSGQYDIDINGHRFIWNTVTDGWISRADSHDTIGCIHTTQGFDLNYVGVIFGREIDYNPTTNLIEIDLNLFYDRNVKTGCDEETVKRYIINTYATMLARGIKGCYVYAYNKNLSDYLHKFIKTFE